MARPGTISPAAKVWIWNLLSVASPTALAMISQPPQIVSSDFGQLAGMRHLIVGMDCAIAGAATALAASPTPAVLRNWRRFILQSSLVSFSRDPRHPRRTLSEACPKA